MAEEKPNRFPTPIVQELTEMARQINSKQNDEVIGKILANPKVLVADADVPTTLQVGFRYNALHIAAKADNKEIILYILNTISSVEFMKLIYPRDTRTVLFDRIKHIMEAYLNTPDRMANETPLHFACKFLSVGAVEALVSHPVCNINVTNSYQETPEMIIGTRGNSGDEDFLTKKNLVSEYIKSRYIIPIWRDSMNSINPIIGDVTEWKHLGNRIPKKLLTRFPDLELSALTSCTTYPKEINSGEPKGVFDEGVSWKIRAYGGPTTLSKAHELLAALKLTGGRGLATSSSPAPPPVLYDSKNQPIVANSECRKSISIPYQAPSPNVAAPVTPPRKSMPVNIPGSPYRHSPLMQRYMSVVSPDSPVSPGPRDVTLRRKDPEKGLELLCRKYAAHLGIPWSEDWTFLNFYGDILSSEGLEALENFLSKVENRRKLAQFKLYCQKGYHGNGRIGNEDNLPLSISHNLNLGSPQPISPLHEIINRLATLKLNTSDGYPTPQRINECGNIECKFEGRFCTCSRVAPSLYFNQSSEEMNDSSNSFEGYSSGGFEFHDSGDSIISTDSYFTRTREIPYTMNIFKLDEEHRNVKMIDSDEEDSKSQSNPGLNLTQSEEAEHRADEVFQSAESSPYGSLEYEDCTEDNLFLNEDAPSKYDYQVYRVMQEAGSSLEVSKYPLVFQWFNTMKTKAHLDKR